MSVQVKDLDETASDSLFIVQTKPEPERGSEGSRGPKPLENGGY
jgi:hypothetical protein